MGSVLGVLRASLLQNQKLNLLCSVVTPCLKKPQQKHRTLSVFLEEILKILLKAPMNNTDEFRRCPTTFSVIVVKLLCQNMEFKCFAFVA